jgi:Ca2+-transporting ATPase
VVYGELFRALAARSQTWTFWQLGPLTNPSLFGAVIVSALFQAAIVSIPLFQPVFQTSSHSWWEWTILALLALTPVTVIEGWKIIRQFWGMTSGTPR